eukprot:1737052-Pleurochrysis_carterae.AAC.2
MSGRSRSPGMPSKKASSQQSGSQLSGGRAAAVPMTPTLRALWRSVDGAHPSTRASLVEAKRRTHDSLASSESPPTLPPTLPLMAPAPAQQPGPAPSPTTLQAGLTQAAPPNPGGRCTSGAALPPACGADDDSSAFVWRARSRSSSMALARASCSGSEMAPKKDGRPSPGVRGSAHSGSACEASIDSASE